MHKLKRWGGVMIIILLLLLGSEVLADEQEIHDGYWWKNKTESFKLGYVVGFTEGWIEMLDEWKIEIRWDLMYAKNLQDTVAHQSDLESLSRHYGWVYGVKFGDMVDGLDHFYSDYRNRNIKFCRALEIVCNEIKGESPERIELLTRRERLMAQMNNASMEEQKRLSIELEKIRKELYPSIYQESRSNQEK